MLFTLLFQATIRYDRWFALENWQASCQFNLAHKLKKVKDVLNGTKKVKIKIKKQTVMWEIREYLVKYCLYGLSVLYVDYSVVTAEIVGYTVIML